MLRSLSASLRYVATRSPVTAISARSLSLSSRRRMPVCTVDTNLPRADVPTSFASDLLSVVSTTLNKPEKLCSVIVRPDVSIARAGNTNPSAHVHIWSIGVFDEHRNPEYSKTFMEFVTSQLNLTHDRVTLFFVPIERHDAGHLLYSDQMEQHSSQAGDAI